MRTPAHCDITVQMNVAQTHNSMLFCFLQRELNAKTYVDVRDSFHRIQLDEQSFARACAEPEHSQSNALAPITHSFCSRRIRTEAIARSWRKTCNTVASAEHTRQAAPFA